MQLDSLILEAIETQENKCLHLGKINKELISDIKNKVQNLPKGKSIIEKRSYDLVINQSEIRHLMADKKLLILDEIKKYIRLVPNIVVESDYVSYVKDSKNEGLRFKKMIDGKTYISFIIVSNKKGTLSIKSIHLSKKDYEKKKHVSIE